MTLHFLSQDAPPADTAEAPASPDDRATEFKPHQGGGDVAPGEVLLVEAYAVMWLLAFLLIFLSFRRQKNLDQRISQLQEDLARARREGG